jgi:hypothetical protein
MVIMKADQEKIEAIAGHQKVPKEEAVMKTVGTLEAEETDLWQWCVA